MQILKNKTITQLLSITAGTLAGLISVYICLKFNLAVFGFNISIIISPVIAGFVETITAQYLTQKTSGAISAIILFIITNMIGWIFPANPIKLNLFTIGGLLLMLQAAFPLTINCIIIGVLLVIITNLGKMLNYIINKFKKENIHQLNKIKIKDETNILIINEKIGIPIKQYLKMIVVEDIIEFKEKTSREAIEYMGSSLEDKKKIKHEDYLKSKEFIENELKKEAQKIGANAIVNLKVEYTNYNQQIPPDMLIIAYGTAVVIDEKYL